MCVHVFMYAHIQLEVTGQLQVSIVAVHFCFETASLIGPELHQKCRHNWPASPPVGKLLGACPSPHIAPLLGLQVHSTMPDFFD